ncbi:MAG: hypothetical protein OXC61_02255 [Flavobacteriaceae bacterium]|nr:hypothetical protein [Flavobacteriaceae bacterium]
MDWFQKINTGAKELSKQEIRNAIHQGSWVTDAKKIFTSNSG